MLLMLGMFLATGTVQNIFAVSILGYDLVTNAELNLWMIPGMVASGVMGMMWFRQNINIKFFCIIRLCSINSLLYYYVFLNGSGDEL